MKRVLVMFVAVLMVLGFSVVGFAQGEKATMGSDQPMASGNNMGSMDHVMNFWGKVTAVDKTANTITVKGKEGEKTFDVSKVTTGEILSGEMVRVKYSKQGEGMILAASSVTMVKPKLSNGAKEGVTNELGVKKEGM
jgi:hypothetical protein